MTSKEKVMFICEVLGSDIPQNFQLRAFEKDILVDLARLEKLEKVIEILTTKKVYESVIISTDSCYAYNSLMDYREEQLKEEEYELLKEVLFNEQIKTDQIE